MSPRRRRARGYDPYEYAAEQLEADRRARESGDLPELPGERLNRDLSAIPRPNRKWLIVAVVVLLLFLVVRGSRNGATYPSLATSCSKPALALSVGTVKQQKVVAWSATGPADTHVVLAIGIASFSAESNGKLAPVPDKGLDSRHIQQVSTELPLAKCSAHGRFVPQVPVGTYRVRLFRLAPSGGTAIASQQLAITAR